MALLAIEVGEKVDMADLLLTALGAHGVIDHWNKFWTLKAEVSIAGALWPVKGQAEILKHANVSALIHEQNLTTIFTDRTRERLLAGASAVAAFAEGWIERCGDDIPRGSGMSWNAVRSGRAVAYLVRLNQGRVGNASEALGGIAWGS